MFVPLYGSEFIYHTAVGRTAAAGRKRKTDTGETVSVPPAKTVRHLKSNVIVLAESSLVTVPVIPFVLSIQSCKVG